MKTVIDLDEDALAGAMRELGTKTKKDTVNAALAYAAARSSRVQAALDDPFEFGVGPDIANPDIMAAARR